MKSFRIDKTTFLCETTKESENKWKAEMTYIQRESGKDAVVNYRSFGVTEEEAINGLKDDLNNLFLIRNEDIGLKDIAMAVFRWIKSGGSTSAMTFRTSLVLLICFFLLFFFVDFRKGPFTTLKSNLEFVWSPNVAQADTGFLTEQFMASAFQSTNKVMWASNVSFRNLAVGNKANLERFLKRKTEFKLVLLDTASALAEDKFLSSFSRTAKKEDIVKTLASMLNAHDGSFANSGDKSHHQLFLAAYSPIVPLIRIDDSLYVSFPIHTDKARTQSNYGRPYLKFHVESKIGSMLVDHFNNMINSADTRQVYPGVK